MADQVTVAPAYHVQSAPLKDAIARPERLKRSKLSLAAAIRNPKRIKRAARKRPLVTKPVPAGMLVTVVQ